MHEASVVFLFVCFFLRFTLPSGTHLLLGLASLMLVLSFKPRNISLQSPEAHSIFILSLLSFFFFF